MNAVAQVIAAPTTTPTEQVARLVKTVVPFSPDTTVNEASESFLSEENRPLLSIPVVQEGTVVGIVSRYQVMQVYLRMYGRELYGKRTVGMLMNSAPLLVDGSLPIEDAAQFITDRLSFPVMDDFVMVQEGRYLGMGIVLDLLKAMEERVARKNEQISDAYIRLKRSQFQLVQSEKMASLGQMVAGVAHEINTPLGYVRNNVELIGTVFDQARLVIDLGRRLLESLSAGSDLEPEELIRALERLSGELDPETLEEFVNLMADTRYGIEQINELVVSLKNFARLDQAPVDNVSLNDLIDSALVIARNNLKRKATVSIDRGQLPLISCRPSHINQVILNLLNNAVQAMDEPGRIQIRTWTDEKYVNAAIADTGRGIAPELLPRIFDPFFTTKRVGEGTGLGLAICYQIIQQHTGRIRVKSTPGSGSTFTIRLPHADQSGTESRENET